MESENRKTILFERAMDELQRDVRGAVPTVQQVFIDPTPTREGHATQVAVSAT
jgi:hypothetical protein